MKRWPRFLTRRILAIVGLVAVTVAVTAGVAAASGSAGASAQTAPARPAAWPTFTFPSWWPWPWPIWPTPTPTPSQPPALAPTPAAPTPAGTPTPTIVVSPSGNDSAAGTATAPFKTVQKAVNVAKPGSVIGLRAGVYTPTAKISLASSGTATQPITLEAYSSEQPVIDGSALASDQKLLSVSGSYWTVDGIELRNSPQQAVFAKSVSHDIFRRLNIHDNKNTGLDLTGDNDVGNLIENVDSHNNHDDATKGQNADGIGVKLGSGTGNVIRGARLFDNSDDGIDLWDFTSPVTIENSWSYGNGVNRWNISGFQGNGNGFKLGGASSAIPAVKHVVTNDAAWGNAHTGFTENSNPGAISVTSTTAYGNGSSGYYFEVSSSILRANLSVGNSPAASIGGKASASGNSWNLGGSYTASSFTSVNDSAATGPRAADGSLPNAAGFLVLKSNPNKLGATL